MQKVAIIIALIVKSSLLASSKEKDVTQIPINKLKIIICLAETQKIRAIAAGKIKSAVIKKTPTILTDKAIVSASKIVKDKFQKVILTPSILAKSAFILMSKILRKAKMV